MNNIKNQLMIMSLTHQVQYLELIIELEAAKSRLRNNTLITVMLIIAAVIMGASIRGIMQ